MDTECEIIRSEIADVRQIVYNECWLEGERRGCAVDVHDGVVQERVADIILKCAGAVLRGKYAGLERTKPSI
ncbi:MAG: hypothetical protein JWL59_2942 [Chthoniobacteraceae bacterium]|nr:hypothetical protein [Chthoniobacteraceae bacterium]